MDYKITYKNDDSESVIDAVHIRVNKEDIWNVDLTVAPMVLALLKGFKEKRQGYPVGLSDNEWSILDTLTLATFSGVYSRNNMDGLWTQIINDMIYAFEKIVAEQNNAYDDPLVTLGTTMFGLFFCRICM